MAIIPVASQTANILDIYATDGTLASVIDAAGDFGIGNTNPGYKLVVNGTVAFTNLTNPGAGGGAETAVCINNAGELISVGGDTCSLSSARFKHNIQSLDSSSGLSFVRQLRPVSFEFNVNNQARVGFIAEEVAVLDPRLTFTDIGTATVQGVRYQEMTAILAKAIQELATTTSFISNQWASTTALMTVDGNGNIGIGTTTPEYKLHVLGDVAATSFVNISTRTAKKDISYLTDTEESNILTKIKDINVATYHYNSENPNSPLRLGLIAEEAPQEVLSAGGKGVDVYKFSTFLLAGIQAQQVQIETIQTRLSALENRISQMGTSTTSSITSLSDVLKDEIKALVGTIKELSVDAITSITGIFKKVETDTIYVKNGMEIKDQATGNVYCVTIKNGEWDKQIGTCPLIPSNPAPTAPSNTASVGDAGTSSETTTPATEDGSSAPADGSATTPVDTTTTSSDTSASAPTSELTAGETTAPSEPVAETTAPTSEPAPAPAPEPTPEPAPAPAPESASTPTE